MQWGNILNDFLSVEHASDGTLKRVGQVSGIASLGADGIVPPSQLPSPLALQALIMSGLAVTGTNVLPPGLLVPIAATLGKVVLWAGTAPSGGPLTVQVIQNGSTTLATISLASGSTSSQLTGLKLALNSGDIITFNITAIGPTYAGANIAVALIGA